MFTVYHFIWLAVCAALIAGTLVFLKQRRPPLKSVLSVCCVLCVLSELVKDLSVIKMVPSSDGSMLLPYMEMQHLPFHLCSIQILLIFFVRFARPGRGRTTVLAFMYPTALIGAALALAMPSIFSTSIEVSQAFTHPLAYQFFLYHSMLVVLGAYIPLCGEVELRPKHYFSTLGILGGDGHGLPLPQLHVRRRHLRGRRAHQRGIRHQLLFHLHPAPAHPADQRWPVAGISGGHLPAGGDAHRPVLPAGILKGAQKGRRGAVSPHDGQRCPWGRP